MEKLLNRIKEKIVNSIKAVHLFVIILFGGNRIAPRKYDFSQTYIFMALFVVAFPFTLLLFGWAGISTLLTTIIVFQIIINADEALMLSYLFAEYGLDKVLNYNNNFKQWMEQERKSYSVSFSNL